MDTRSLADDHARRPSISLLHATYHREGGPSEVHDAWLARALHPERVQYVLAADEDDDGARIDAPDVTRVTGSADPEWSTAVRNWNAAAAAATGDLLFVIADDVLPPSGWDDSLDRLLDGIDPRHLAVAVKLTDDPAPDDVRLRHPLLTRAFYARFGLFHPDFHGVFCDDDFTLRAFWKAAIIDGRSLVLDHQHPSLVDGVGLSESHRKANRPIEYRHGEAVLLRRWPLRRRTVPVLLVPPDMLRDIGRVAARLRRKVLWAYARDWAGRRLRLMVHPRRAISGIARRVRAWRALRGPVDDGSSAASD